MRDLAITWMETHYQPFGGLRDTIRTGRCAATEFYGEPFFGWLSGQPEQIARFSRAMGNLTSGIKLHAIDPEATGVVFDLPHVVAEAEHRLPGYGLGDRLGLAAGDFFSAVPPGADTYLLSMILHDWSDAEARQLLATIKAAAPAGARLAAFELVVPDGDTPHMAKMIDLTMLLEDAGFKFEGISATPTPVSVIAALA